MWPRVGTGPFKINQMNINNIKESIESNTTIQHDICEHLIEHGFSEVITWPDRVFKIIAEHYTVTKHQYADNCLVLTQKEDETKSFKIDVRPRK